MTSTAEAQTSAFITRFQVRREAEALLFIALSSLQHHIEQDIDAHDKDEQHQRNAEQRLCMSSC